jgi:hypothetical protein
MILRAFFALAIPAILAAVLLAQAPRPAEIVAENLLSFDSGKIRIEWNHRHWQLVQEGVVLKDFGPNESDARLALSLIRELGLNQLGRIGADNQTLEYWLKDGHAPSAMPRSNLRLLPLELPKIKVEAMQGHWCLKEGPRILFSFGSHESDARRAFDILHRYQFNHVGIIGRANPSMYVFFTQHTQTSPNQMTGSRAMETPKFSRLAKNKDGTPKFESFKSNKPVPQELLGADQLFQPLLPKLSKPTSPNHSIGHEMQWRMTKNPITSTPSSDSEKISFDWRQVALRQEGAEWKLVAGRTELANLGTNVQDARTAISALRYYRFTEQHRFGGPQPYFTYFPAPGVAPRGLMLGLRGQEIQTKDLKIAQENHEYVLMQKETPVIRLRDREADAKTLLDTIQRNQYDRICRLGEPGKETMSILIRSR